jgi:elongation factor P hydroxylase
MQHNYKDLIHIFEQCFFQTFNTKLIKGDHEPLYSPADVQCDFHKIIFAHGYYSSALHEISHWCLAGANRRLLEDFGYWYMPDGRNAEQQIEFEKVEIKPQAIEWAFCVAAGKKFNVSADNLNGATPDTLAFKKNVYRQVQHYIHNGFPNRVEQFIIALANFYQVELPLKINQFHFPEQIIDNEVVVDV